MRTPEQRARHLEKLKAKIIRQRPKCAYWECENRITLPKVKFCSDKCARDFHNAAILPRDVYDRLGGLKNPIYSDSYKRAYKRFAVAGDPDLPLRGGKSRLSANPRHCYRVYRLFRPAQRYRTRS